MEILLGFGVLAIVFFVLVIEKDRYIVEETTKHRIIRWFISDADNNKRLELAN